MAIEKKLMGLNEVLVKYVLRYIKGEVYGTGTSISRVFQDHVIGLFEILFQ